MAPPKDNVNSNRIGRWIAVDAGRERETIAQQLAGPLTQGIDGDVLWEDKLSS